MSEGHAKFQLKLAKIIMKINMYLFRTPRIPSMDLQVHGHPVLDGDKPLQDGVCSLSEMVIWVTHII